MQSLYLNLVSIFSFGRETITKLSQQLTTHKLRFISYMFLITITSPKAAIVSLSASVKSLLSNSVPQRTK